MAIDLIPYRRIVPRIRIDSEQDRQSEIGTRSSRLESPDSRNYFCQRGPVQDRDAHPVRKTAKSRTSMHNARKHVTVQARNRFEVIAEERKESRVRDKRRAGCLKSVLARLVANPNEMLGQPAGKAPRDDIAPFTVAETMNQKNPGCLTVF